jgi:hypothetical protein
MSNAVHTQPERTDIDAVVSVCGDALREARTGLVLSLLLVAILVAAHPHWSVLAVFAGVELIGIVHAAVRAVLTFRKRLDHAEPLPAEAVEATGQPKRRPLDWKQASSNVLAIAGIGATVVFGGSEWVARIAAVGIAAAVAYRLMRPLSIAYLAAQWERRHGRGRLFRPFVRDEDDEGTLYVADRPVPAA